MFRLYALLAASAAALYLPAARLDAQTVLGPLTLSGYLDAYYSDEFGDSSVHQRQVTPSGVSPVYSFGKNNTFAVNEAFLDAKLATDSFHAALGIQGGTYVDANYASESEITRHLYEAYAGLRIAKDLWFDAGIFASHIGLESAVSKDNWTLTRSLVADNTPYYETGAKATYTPGSRWLLSALVLNGWQNIRDNNSNKAIGTQIQYKPNDALVFDSSTFVGEGRNDPTPLERERYFHDFYFTDQIDARWAAGVQLDVGWEEKSHTDHALNSWTSGAAIAHFQISPRYAVSARAEFYHDPDGVIIATGTPGNFSAYGGSAGLDYAPAKNLLTRVELRSLRADHPVFVHGGELWRDSTYATAAFCVSF